MKRNRNTVLDKIEKYLFDPDTKPDSIVFSQKDEEIRKRYIALYTLQLEKPHLTDKQLVKFLMGPPFKIEKSQAYRDVFNVKYLLGNINNASKEFDRYTLIQGQREAFQMARAQKNPDAMSRAYAVLGKYTKLDQEEIDLIKWLDIPDPDFEPTMDVSVISEKLTLPNVKELRLKLRAKYKVPVTDVDFEEINENPKKEIL